MKKLKKSALDLVACEEEPIERPQAIQAVCSLLLFDRATGRIAMGSDNLEPIFGAPLADLIGSKADALFEPSDAAALNEMMYGEERPVSRYLQLRGRREHFVRVFETEGYLGVELNAWEDAQEKPIQLGLDVGNTLQLIEEHAASLTSPTDKEICDLAQFVADEFRKFSGYDRSMIYRFDADWNGEIIAESRSDNAPGSFLGLSFPSSDIPAQARRLFVLNRVRPVVDIEQGSVPLLPALNPKTQKPVDLSDCSVRAVSPVHVEYLQNMGVRATLNIALMARGKLWGLLSNHHYTAPYRLTPARAASCRLLAEIFSTELTRIHELTENVEANNVRSCLRALRKTLLEIEPEHNLGSLLAGREDNLLQALGVDGAALKIKDAIYCFGDVPDMPLIEKIEKRTSRLMSEQQTTEFSTHYAVGLWPDLAGRIGKTAAGVFACKFPSEDTGLLMFCKPRAIEITWGGDPYKRVQPGDGDRLHPRKSFEKFTDSVKDRSLPWPPETAAKARECVIGLSELDWLLAWRKTEMELAETRAEVAHAALHDSLTNLPNRRYLMDVFNDSNVKSGVWGAVLHLDLDGFKQINDQLGHAMGDSVLVEVASRLRTQTRRSDFCARIGGDEFVVLGGRDLSKRDLIDLGERIVKVMQEPVRLGQQTCHIGASVGIAFIQDIPRGSETMLHQADMALYQSKRDGRGRVTIYTAELEERLRHTKKLGEEVLGGINGRQFVPWYQPQIDAKTFKVCGVEALLRWDHPEFGVLTPDKFLETAQATGHIATLDTICMERAIADYESWQAAGIDIPKVSLNISYDRLADPDLITSIREANLPQKAFSLELLETIYLDETTKAVEANLASLREQGIKLEIDDFGTGKTSIVSLVRLRPDRLKIDRQLIMPIVNSPQSRQLVSSIVEIGTSLGIGITAEGVESLEHATVLRDMGVTVLQGYAFARPMPAAQLADFVRKMESRVA